MWCMHLCPGPMVVLWPWLLMAVAIDDVEFVVLAELFVEVVYVTELYCVGVNEVGLQLLALLEAAPFVRILVKGIFLVLGVFA